MKLSLPRNMPIDVQAGHCRTQVDRFRLESDDRTAGGPVRSHGALAVKNGRLVNAFCALWGSNLAPLPFSSKDNKKIIKNKK